MFVKVAPLLLGNKLVVCVDTVGDVCLETKELVGVRLGVVPVVAFVAISVEK